MLLEWRSRLVGRDLRVRLRWHPGTTRGPLAFGFFLARFATQAMRTDVLKIVTLGSRFWKGLAMTGRG